MIRVSMWTLVLCAGVRVLSLPAALRLITVQTEDNPGPDTGDEEIVTAVDAVLRIKRFVFTPICWKRAALLHHFLGLRGCATTIIFGLRKDPAGELTGHAWLEKDGRPIFEPEHPNYVATYKFPSAETCDVDLARMVSD
jgi:hypothetical protein